MRLRFSTQIGLTLLSLTALWLLAVGGGDPTPEGLMRAAHWKRARALVDKQCPSGSSGSTASSAARCAYLLAQVKEAFGDIDGARPLAEKAVAFDSQNSSYHYLLGQLYGETAEKASFFSKAGWGKKFKAESELAAALDPKNLDARFALLEYDIQAPRLMGGGKDRAAAMADEIAKIDPAQGYLAEARLAQDTKQSAKEEAMYAKAAAAASSSYNVLTAIANFYAGAAQKKYDLAEQYAHQALKLDASRIDAYSALAAVYVSERRWTDLEAVFEQAEVNVPDDLSPYYQAGRALLLDSKELPRAETYFREYLTREAEGGAPTLAHAHWRLGLVLEREGRKSEAIAEIATAVRLKPDLEEAKKDLKRLKG